MDQSTTQIQHDVTLIQAIRSSIQLPHHPLSPRQCPRLHPRFKQQVQILQSFHPVPYLPYKLSGKKPTDIIIMNKPISVSVIGLGFVGSAMLQTFREKGMKLKTNLFGYDKFKNEEHTSSLEECINTSIMFFALPTQFKHATKEYDKSAIFETCERLIELRYKGVIVIKSTVEPETTRKLSERFPQLVFIHNPEFLSAATAKEDFKNQKHIVLGKSENCSEKQVKILEEFYSRYFPEAKISICTSLESQSMKIFCNCFYSVKIQFFTELYLLCQKNGCNYDTVKSLMLGNGWINPMHTTVPGNDGNISYGGYCFPKDTNALNEYMAKMDVPNSVLEAVIAERNSMRQDHTNQS